MPLLTAHALSFSFGGAGDPRSKLKSRIAMGEIRAAEEVGLKAFNLPYMLQIVYNGGILYCQAQHHNDRIQWLSLIRKAIRDNPSLHTMCHPGVYEGRWSCCQVKQKTNQGCEPAFDYT